VNPDDLDRAVSVALRSRAEQVQTVIDPLPDVQARARRLSRNRVLLSVLPVLVSAVAAGSVAIAIGLSGSGDAEPATGTTGSTSPTPQSSSSQPPSVPVTRDDALRRQLAVNHDARMALLGRPVPIGRVFCGITVEGADAAKTHLFVWVVCEDITIGTDATVLSGGATSAVLTVSGHGASVRLIDAAFPRMQHLRADIDRMFPPGIAQVMQRGNIRVTPGDAQLLDEARRAG
jgi:hypothetical protein